MGELANYRRILNRILTDYAEYISGQPQSEPYVVMDERHDHYLIVFAGWHGAQRELRMHVYVRLSNGKIWIEEDGTEFGIAQRLTDAGVPKHDIVLAFQTPAERRLGEFAVA
ncbi:MAG: XisI protein [Anaerolineae bacterium]|nr:XisI protein [Anaerolineae bacterium]